MKRSSLFLLGAFAVTISGCGSDTGEGQALPGSSISINPPDITWTGVAAPPSVDLTQSYTIVVNGPSGAPLKDTKVQIFLDLSDGTLTPPPVMQLLDQNGVPQTSPYEARTNDIGTIQVSVEFPVGGGLEYTGSLQAFSGGAFNNSTITVTCSDC